MGFTGVALAINVSYMPVIWPCTLAVMHGSSFARLRWLITHHDLPSDLGQFVVLGL